MSVRLTAAAGSVTHLWASFQFSAIVYVYFVVSLTASLHLLWQLVYGPIVAYPYLTLHMVTLVGWLLLGLIRGAATVGVRPVRAWLVASGQVCTRFHRLTNLIL